MIASQHEFPNSSIPLSELADGSEARVSRLDGKQDHCQRLREIGFCESAVITKISGRSMLLCQVCGSRIALNQHLARNIHVEPVRNAR